MSGVDPSSLPNRSVSSPDTGVARVARSQGLHEKESTPQQLSQWQGRPYNGDDPSTGRRGHSDPAVSLSASFAKIALGTTVKATVIGFDTPHQPVIKTDHGTFIVDISDIKPPLDLKVDTHLDLKIVAIDHVIEAQLVTKNNVALSPPPLLNLTLVGVDTIGEDETKALATPATIKAGAQTPAAPVQYTPQPAQTAMMSALAKLPPVPLPPSQFLNLRAAGDSSAASALALAPPAQGQGLRQPLMPTAGDPNLLGELETVLLPLTSSASDATSAKPPAVTGQVLNATVVSTEVTKAAQPGETAAPRLTAGQNILVKIVDVGPAATPLPPPGAALVAAQPEKSLWVYPSGQLPSHTSVWRTSGEVIRVDNATPAQNSTQTGTPEKTPADQKTLLISTPAGIIRLQAPADLAAGSHVVLDLTQAAAPQPAPAAAPAAPAAASNPPLTGQPGKWTAIENILAKLAAVSPDVAARLETRIASPLGHLGGATLALAKALGSGNAAELWLGRSAVDALTHSGNQSLIAALNDDFQRLSHQARDSAPGDWRTLLLPIRDGRDMQALPILIRSFESEPQRHENPGEQEKAAAKSERVVRFVVDVSLSRLGAVQMDGMIRARTFSLIMRTEQALGGHISGKIRDIFSAALARNQFEGDLVFRPGTPFPLAANDFLASRDGSGNQGNIPGNIYV